MHDNHQNFIDRFVENCRADDRVVAAFLGGSYARGTADQYSDLDLYLITAEESFEDFRSGPEAFLSRLGELVFAESFDIPDIVFYVFADGVEGELGIGRESAFIHIHSGPYHVLLDKKNILAGAVFSGREPDPVEQAEKLRRVITWFWHEVSHFTTALARGQLWWARGQLDELRHTCVKLARFQENFFDADAGEEGYFKVDTMIPNEQLASLQETFCPMEEESMLRSAFVLIRYYQEIAIPLAQRVSIPYPKKLEQVTIGRLEKLRDSRSS